FLISGNMARIPILRFGSLADHARQLNFASYTPSIRLEGLVRGVDNLRHDVYLSPRFCDEARAYIGSLIARFGNVTDLIADDKQEQRKTNLLLRRGEER